MRIIAISDTHNKHNLLNKDLEALNTGEPTIIIHAGDLTTRGAKYDVYAFINWFAKLPFTYKVFIAGNHDFWFETEGKQHDEDLQETLKYCKELGVTYLLDQEVEIEGFRIYGSPWQPEFYNWAFNVPRGEAIAQKWINIPSGLDVLVTHGPVFGILDDTYNGMRVGCEELYKKVMEVKPRVHICGHIHYGYGVSMKEHTVFINAAVLGEDYRYTNYPIIQHI